MAVTNNIEIYHISEENLPAFKVKQELSDFEKYGLEKAFNQLLQDLTESTNDFSDLISYYDNTVQILDGCYNVITVQTPLGILHAHDLTLTENHIILLTCYDYETEIDEDGEEIKIEDYNHINWDKEIIFRVN